MDVKKAGIYSITSKLNGKRYVGSAIRIHKRWIIHLSLLKLNKHHSQHLQNHYNKYGKDDLIFTILEIVERNDLTLEEHKQQLLKVEQTYLDNWNECHFNEARKADSCLGYKNSKAKYYCYYSRNKSYQTFYTVQGKEIRFTSHLNEEDAIKEVEYIKTLTEQELLDYKKECSARPAKKPKDAKNYSFKKERNKWVVGFKSKYKTTYFGGHLTEAEAIKEVEYIKTLTEKQVKEYHKKYNSRPTKSDIKNYYFNKTTNKWAVRFSINSKRIFFGNYSTEKEAIEKVKQIKLELGI